MSEVALSPADQHFLAGLIAEAGGCAGSVHRLQGQTLTLSAMENLPPAVVEIVREVPAGKGMAGLALSRRAPVQTCDLKTDDSGDVRPGARAVEAGAAVALPVYDAAGAVRAVVGIAFTSPGDLPPSRIEALAAAAAALPEVDA